MGAIDLVSSRIGRYLLFDRMNRAYCRWQLDQFAPYFGQRVLEIGCGVGGIIDLLGPRELIYGLDVEADVLDYAAERFRHRPECRFELLNIAEADAATVARFRGQQFDTIVCMNVLEHIRD